MDGQNRRDRLGELVAVVRAEKQPELDLARLEARLAEQFEAARARGELRPKVRADGARRMAPWLAVAAVVLLGLGLARALGVGLSGEWTALFDGDTAPRDPTALVTVRSLDGEAVALGASVVAGTGQVVRVQHASRAMWELTAGSGAHLSDAGSGVLCVELEHGALSAVVTPSRAESFIVRARGTEVAVHGTRFRVEMDERRVVVSVSEGEVEVRPLERTTRARLAAGMRAAFVGGVPEVDVLAAPAPPALSAGDRGTEPAPSPEVSQSAEPGVTVPPPAPARKSAAAEPAPRLSQPKSSAPRGSKPRAGTEPPASAAAADVPAAVADAAIARVTEHIQDCFRRHTSGRGPVSIEAATHVSLEVQPSGLILGVSLDPPLAPHVEACVASALATLNLGASEAGYRVKREIRLSP